jgi:hypothetical protein
VLRPAEEDPDLERIRPERPSWLQPDGLRRALAGDDVRLPLVREHRRTRLALQRREPAEVGAVRMRQHDAPEVARRAAEPADRAEHVAGVVLEERVHERQLAGRVEQERAHVAALAAAEDVHARRELPHPAHPTAAAAWKRGVERGTMRRCRGGSTGEASPRSPPCSPRP